MRRPAFIATATALLLASITFSAPSFAQSAEPAEETHWYGWQTLLADGASFTLLFSSLASDSGQALPALGLGAFLLGGPVIHLAHDRGGVAAGSLALRVGLPVAGGFIGLKASECKRVNDYSCDDPGEGLAVVVGTFLGASVGALVASGIDAAALAQKTTPRRAGVQLTPELTPVSGGLRAGLRGTF
jgi:hypothetical protein